MASYSGILEAARFALCVSAVHTKHHPILSDTYKKEVNSCFVCAAL